MPLHADPVKDPIPEIHPVLSPAPVCPLLSVVIPHVDVYPRFAHCLDSVLAELPANVEVITVADGNCPESGPHLRDLEVIAVQLERQQGAAAARNAGARVASGEVLLFLDSDIILTPSFYSHLMKHLQDWQPGRVLQGMYQASTPETGSASRYKNLYYFFNYTRRIRSTKLTSISSHCVAIGRTDFEALGGFDSRLPGASIEDAELGLRITQSGLETELDRELEVTHAKRYSLASLSRTDFTLSRNKARSYLGHGRSLCQQPNLVAVSGGRPRDMLVVVLSVFLIPIAVVLALFAPLVSALIVALVLVLNLPFYSFLAQQEGLAFAVIGVCISLVDFVVCSAGALVGALEYAVGRRF